MAGPSLVTNRTQSPLVLPEQAGGKGNTPLCPRWSPEENGQGYPTTATCENVLCLLEAELLLVELTNRATTMTFLPRPDRVTFQ